MKKRLQNSFCVGASTGEQPTFDEKFLDKPETVTVSAELMKLYSNGSINEKNNKSIETKLKPK